MSTFGELVEESSRAFADDEEEDEIYNNFGVTFEASTSGASLTNEPYNLYMFHGKVAAGFGEGFLNQDQFKLLGNLYFTGVESTVDSLLHRSGKRPVVRVYQGPGVVFAFVDTYGVPRFLANEVVNEIETFVVNANNVVVFHSEPVAGYRGIQSIEGKLFFLKSSVTSSELFKSTATPLPQPNIVSGVSAAVLTFCEIMDKPGVVLMTYSESELIDSISLKPFANAIGKINSGDLNLKRDFEKLKHNSERSAMCNLTHVSETNLYA